MECVARNVRRRDRVGGSSYSIPDRIRKEIQRGVHGLNRKNSAGKTDRDRIVRLSAGLLSLALILSAIGGCGKESAGDTSNRLGKEAFDRGRYDEALVAFDQAVSEDPAVPEYYSNKALTYLKMGEDQEAMKCIRKALDISSEDKEVYRVLGIAYMHQEDYEQALEAFQTATSLSTLITDATDYDVLEYRGEAQMHSGKPIAAYDTYTALIGLKWNLSENYFRRAMAGLAREDLDEEIRKGVVEDFDSAVKMAGDGDFELLIDIYYILNSHGDRDNARSYLDRALDAAGNANESNLAWGESNYRQGAYPQAIEAFSQVEDLWERSGSCQTLAASYAANHEYEKAADVYKKYIDTFGSDVRILNELAVCEIEQGKYHEAINHLIRATADVSSIDLPKIRWNLVIAYEKSGNDELAYATLISYLEHYPQDALAIEEYRILHEKLSEAE